MRNIIFSLSLFCAPLAAEQMGTTYYQLPELARGWEKLNELKDEKSWTLVYGVDRESGEFFGAHQSNLQTGEPLFFTKQLQICFPDDEIEMSELAPSSLYEWSAKRGERKSACGLIRFLSEEGSTSVLFYQTELVEKFELERAEWLEALEAAKLLPTSSKFAQLKEELGLDAAAPLPRESCHLILVHHGDTDWTVEERLQGWLGTSLNEAGKEQMAEMALKLSEMRVDALYTSSLERAVESAAILQKSLNCPVTINPDLRGESHGNLEGLKKEEYEMDPHFIKYMSLLPEERIFFSVGEGGLSKADVARTAIPAINEICRNHPGQTVVIVTHGGVLKCINFLLGEQINEVPHGHELRLEGDGAHLVLKE
jgi:broad specificity phosphatase PhoE